MHTCTHCKAPLAIWAQEENTWGLPCPMCNHIQGPGGKSAALAHLCRWAETLYQAGGRMGLYYGLAVLQGIDLHETRKNLNLEAEGAYLYWQENFMRALRAHSKLGTYIADAITKRLPTLRDRGKTRRT